MFRLTFVFLVWMASTAYAAEDYEAQLHEAYALAWQEADDDARELLNRAQLGWHVYRAANCALLGEKCYAEMAAQRTHELRALVRMLVADEPCDDLTH